jgi:hypothetical protein
MYSTDSEHEISVSENPDIIGVVVIVVVVERRGAQQWGGK